MTRCLRAMPGAAAACCVAFGPCLCHAQAPLPRPVRVGSEGTPSGWEDWGPRVVIQAGGAGADAIVVSGGPMDPAWPAAAGIGVVSGQSGRIRSVAATRFWLTDGASDEPGERRRVVLGDGLLAQELDPERGAELSILNLDTGAWSAVAELIPGPLGGEPRLLTAADGFTCFVAHDQTLRERVWRSDGTARGTTPLLPHGAAWSLATMNGRVMALGYLLDSSRTAMWRVASADAAPEAVFVLDHVYPAGLIAGPSRVEFGTSEGPHSPTGTTVWRSDGTWPGTFAIGSVPGRAVLIAGGESDDAPRYVRGYISGGLDELWSITPSTGGQGTRLAGPFVKLDTWAMVGSRLVFTVLAWGEPVVREVWVSDGSREGTGRLTGAAGAALRDARVWCSDGAHVYFTASEPTTGAELWRTDGTPSGTVRVTDIAPGPTSSWPHGAVAVNNRVFFGAVDAAGARDLWMIERCGADFDNDNQLGVSDVLGFLQAFFAMDARADFNGLDGVTVSDVLEWLTAYAAGCD